MSDINLGELERLYNEAAPEDRLTAYHFLREDMTSEYAPRTKWAEGQTRRVRGEIIPCEWGYHASPTPFDALQYASGPVLCLVELSGDITPHGDPVDKYAARTRTLIHAVNIERQLRLFAADCAERVLPIYEREFPGDDRPRRAIEAVRRFANGEISAEELAAARAAAWAAAWDAADAAAKAAAKAATRDAADAATWAAADAAAGAAAGAAAKAAADARGEKVWQRETFNAMCLAALREKEGRDVRLRR